jgi:hypothetical protein
MKFSIGSRPAIRPQESRPTGTPECGRLLGSCVTDLIAAFGFAFRTAALECMVKTHPMADFVCGSVAFVIRNGAAARQAGIEYYYAILGRRPPIVRREGGVAQNTATWNYSYKYSDRRPCPDEGRSSSAFSAFP